MKKNCIFKRGLKSNKAIGLTVIRNALQLYTRVYLGSIHHSTPSYRFRFSLRHHTLHVL